MIKYVALYRKPADEADFDERCFSSHLPIVAMFSAEVVAE